MRDTNMRERKENAGKKILPSSRTQCRKLMTATSETDNYNCEMCMIEPRFAMVPCGHQRFCSSCANRVRDEGRCCPIYRTDITFV